MLDRVDIEAGAALVRELEQFLAGLDPIGEGLSLEERFDALVGFQAALHHAGLAVPSWPRALGGRDASLTATVALSRALGAAGAPELINFVATEVLAPALRAYARPEELARWLPRMASAEEIWCQLFSEPDAGSDLASLRTVARPAPDGSWVVSGEKIWSTWGQFATWGLLLARTGPSADRHRAITAFVIDMRTPGIEARPIRSMTGASEFAAVAFHDVAVPSTAVLGPVNGGWDVARVALDSERGSYAVRRAAVIGGAAHELLRSARELQLSASERHVVIEAVMRNRLLDLAVQDLVGALVGGRSTSQVAPVIKQLMTAAEQATFNAILRLDRLHALAWTSGTRNGAVDEYLYSRAASIYGGTAEIQRNLIAERLLGLPRG